MKKVTKVLLVLASSFVITGCKSNIHVLNDAESSEMLKELRKGFKLTAIIKQEAHYLSGYQGDETGEIETNTLKLTTTFDNISDTRGYECSYGTVSDNRYYEAYNTNVYEGEDGYAMYYELNYDNTVITNYVKDSAGNNVNFSFYCSNPFDSIVASDLSTEDGVHYNLKRNKASKFAIDVLSIADEAFYEVIDECVLTIENNMVQSMTLKPVPTVVSYTNYETYETGYYRLFNDVNISFTEIGNATTYRVSPKETKPEHASLQNAFSNLGDNYTLTVINNFYTDDVKEETVEYKFYFDGTNIYFKASDLDEPDSVNDCLLYKRDGQNYLTAFGYDDSKMNWSISAGRAFSSLTGITYEEASPIIKDVRAEIFDYVAKYDEYRACEDIATYIGAICLTPPLSDVSTYLDGYGLGCSVSLVNDKLDYISFPFFKDFWFYTLSGSIDLQFDDIGTTVIPFNALSEINIFDL